MSIILLSAFIALWFCQRDFYRKPLAAWTKSIVIWCTLLFVQTEVMSFFGCLSKIPVFVFWLLVFGGVVCRLYFKRRDCFQEGREFLAKAGNSLRHNKFLTGFFILTGLLALITVPYNWDSMTYHLPRIAHWAQNHSIGHYGTNVIRQISSPLLHEAVGLQIYLLSGGKDVLLNLIQFAAFLTNAGLVYGITQKLGCSSKFCKAGMQLFCSMPIAFGEALTTQNDHFAGMWLLIFTYYILDFLHKEQKICFGRESIGKCMIMAACVGYGYLSKPSVCIGMLLLAMVLLTVCIFRRDSWADMGKLAGVSLPVMVVILAPEMLRNIFTFGWIMHSGAGARQLAGTLDPRYLFVNGLKNLAFNMPNIVVPQSGRLIARIIEAIAYHIGVEINHPSISEDGRYFSLGSPGDYGHDTAVNALVVFAAMAAFLWYLYRKFRNPKGLSAKTGRKDMETVYQRRYTWISVLLMAVFCIVVRWEPFVSRYMLPYLALLCPMVSVQLQDYCRNGKSEAGRRAGLPVLCCFCITQICMLFPYHLGIAVKQEEQPAGYFYNRRGIQEVYLEACSFITNAGYEQIGLMIGEDSYEYPVWGILGDSVSRIEHVGIGNESATYEDMYYVPDCILVTGVSGDRMEQDKIEIHQEIYQKEYSGEDMAVYVKCSF